MGRERWYVLAGFAFLVAAGMLAWRTGPGTRTGQLDLLGEVGTWASLAVSVVALGLAVRAQRQVESDVRDAAARLAVAVGKAETEARRQLLGGDDRTIDVEFTFRRAAAHNASGAAAKGTLEEVVGYYRRLRPRRMVIIGAAGSGKTVLAIELILGLLKDRGEDPVPVRMPAALLDTSRPPESAVRDWLVEHLSRTYRLPEAAARELVAARMVLPVLDGLDEMDAEAEPGYASRAARTIRACNAYLDGTQQAGLVLTCRLDQYQALEQSREWVRDAAQIQIRPVGLPKARTFLVRRVADEDRWRPVLAGMRRNRALAQALSTPWRLTLAAIVYDQRDPGTGAYLRDPADLTNPGLDTEDKIRDHLLALLIPTLTAIHHGLHPASRVHQWLGTLACYLDKNAASATRPGRRVAGRELSATDLILHELWPLAGNRLPRAIPALIPAIGWTTLAAYLLTHMPTGASPQQIAVVGSGLILSMLASIYWPWKTPWPLPSKFDLPQVRTRVGQRHLLQRLGAGLALGLTVGLAFGLTTGLKSGLTGGLAFGLAVGLSYGLTDFDYSPVGPHRAVTSSITVGLTDGLAGGLAFGLTAGLGSGLVFGLVFGLTAGLTAGLLVGLTFGLTDGLTFGLAGGLTAGLGSGIGSGIAAGLAAGFAAGLVAGLAGWRYLALLLCTRRWNNRYLPWRLGRFLHWCYRAGLVRIAGTGYQFRHRELQEYLARHSTP